MLLLLLLMLLGLLLPVQLMQPEQYAFAVGLLRGKAPSARSLLEDLHVQRNYGDRKWPGEGPQFHLDEDPGGDAGIDAGDAGVDARADVGSALWDGAVSSVWHFVCGLLPGSDFYRACCSRVIELPSTCSCFPAVARVALLLEVRGDL